MPPTLAQLVDVRSHFVETVLAYLNQLAESAATLPQYYPAHLRGAGEGRTGFDDVRQLVQVVEDRTSFERWRAEERERLRAAGGNWDRLAYVPTRARPEADDDRLSDRDRSAAPVPIPWDRNAGERFRRAIILGDPGFGKTWLLRYEACRLAREAARGLRERTIDLHHLVLPLFFRLSDLSRSDGPLEETLVALVGRGRPDTFARFVREKLATDRCVLLLDAWDEVATEVPRDGRPVQFEPGYRQRLGQRLEAFARACPGPRLLLTSRIVGYTSSPVPLARELELVALDPPTVEAFVRTWFGEDANVAARFAGLLRQNPQVTGLARIPLMLALMCRSFQDARHTFPARRAGLYDRCLRGLLRDWKKEDKAHAVSDAYVEAVLDVLEKVAHDLFVEGQEQFTTAQLRDVLLRCLNRLKPAHEWHGRNATSIIDELVRDGIFIKAGEDTDSPLLFLHRTFHEYLTACWLARRINRRGWQESGLDQLLDRQCWLPSWQEVIALLAGKLDDPEPLLEILVAADHDDLFRHRLALAARALPEVSAECRARIPHLVNRILDGAYDFWWKRWSGGTRSGVEHLTRALPRLIGLGEKPVEDRLVEQLDDDLSWGSRAAAVEAFAFLGVAAAKPRVLDALRRLVKKGRSEWEALTALSSMDAAVAAVRTVIVAKEQEEDDDPYREGWSMYLDLYAAMYGAASEPRVIDALLTRLGDKNTSVRWAATTALGRIDAVLDPRVVDALLARLGDDNMDVRQAAAEGLGSRRSTTFQSRVMAALLAAVRGEYQPLRYSVTSSFGRMLQSASDPRLIDACLERLREDGWPVKRVAAKSLGALGLAAEPTVIDALVLCLADDWLVMVDCVKALGRMGPAAKAHVAHLLNILLARLDDDNLSVRSEAAESLGALGTAAAEVRVIDALLAHLEDDNSAVREEAATALGKIERTANPRVIDALLARLGDEDEDEEVKGAVVVSFSRMGITFAEPPFLGALLACLGDYDWTVDQAAATALGGIDPLAHPQVLDALLGLLAANARTGNVVAEVLGRMGPAAAQPRVIDALLARLEDTYLVELALAQLGEAAATPTVIGALRNRLDKETNLARKKSFAKALGSLGAWASPETRGRLVADLLARGDEPAAECLTELMTRGVRIRSSVSGWLVCHVSALATCDAGGTPRVALSLGDQSGLPALGQNACQLCQGCAFLPRPQ
jgi:HEAT repeat protein